MKLNEFIDAVEKLVITWQPEDLQAGATHRGALTAIYAEMREQLAHDLAQAVSQREKAIAILHGYYTNKDAKAAKAKPIHKPKRGRPPKL
jgi:hypothetical protein